MSSHDSLKLREKIRSVLAGEAGASISGAELLSGLRSDDLRSAALAEELSSLPQFSKRVRPAPSIGDVERAQFDYYLRCMVEDGSLYEAHSRYEAAAEISSLLSRWAGAEEQDSLLYGKQQLAQAYEQGAPPIRDAIVLGVLEHVLRTPALVALFQDWTARPALASAYAEGLRNSRDIGN